MFIVLLNPPLTVFLDTATFLVKELEQELSELLVTPLVLELDLDLFIFFLPAG